MANFSAYPLSFISAESRIGNFNPTVFWSPFKICCSRVWKSNSSILDIKDIAETITGNKFESPVKSGWEGRILEHSTKFDKSR